MEWQLFLKYWLFLKNLFSELNSFLKRIRIYRITIKIHKTNKYKKKNRTTI